MVKLRALVAKGQITYRDKSTVFAGNVDVNQLDFNESLGIGDEVETARCTWFHFILGAGFVIEMAILWRHRHAVYSSSLYTNERWARFSLYSRIIPGIIINEMRSSYIYLQWCCTHPVVDGSEESGLRQQAKAHFYPCIYRMTDYLYCGPSSYVYLEFLMQSEVYIVIYIQRFYISTLSCAYRYYIMDGSSSLGSLMAFGGLLSLPHIRSILCCSINREDYDIGLEKMINIIEYLWGFFSSPRILYLHFSGRPLSSKKAFPNTGGNPLLIVIRENWSLHGRKSE